MDAISTAVYKPIVSTGLEPTFHDLLSEIIFTALPAIDLISDLSILLAFNQLTSSLLLPQDMV